MNPVLWCIAPEISSVIGRPDHGRLLLSWRGRLANTRLSRSRTPPISCSVHRRVGFLWTTANQERVLRPIAAALGAGVEESTSQVRRLPAWRAAAVDARQIIHREARHRGLEVHPYRLERVVEAVVSAASRVDRLLDRGEIDLLIVGTQHGREVRAALRVAQDHGIATVYVPHAPVATNHQYADLPVNRAWLRGPKEIDHYRGLGVHHGLAAIGNPGALPAAPAALDTALPPVLAISPEPVDLLERLSDMLLPAWPGEVVVAPHPRSEAAEIAAAIRPGWTRSTYGRTVDLLQAGHWAIVEHSSGVAWEALALGVPVVDVRLLQDDPNYPFLGDPAVIAVREPTEMRPALERARVIAQSEAERDVLRSVAAAWCSATGETAIENALGLIDEARGSDASDVLLDSFTRDWTQDLDWLMTREPYT